MDFYLDYLSANNAGLFLPTSIKSYLDGQLDQLEGRMSSLLYKQAVEQDVLANLFAYGLGVDMDTLQKLRVRCVKEVRETNGEIRLEDALLYQKGAEV